MPRPSKSAHADPLIAALIAKLPEPGTKWPDAEQAAWLDLMKRAISMTYVSASRLFAEKEPQIAFDEWAKKTDAVIIEQLENSSAWTITIDEKGYVRNQSGKRLNKKEVNGSTVFDKRGEDGDLRSIIWADDSTGVTGVDINVTA